MIKARDPAWLVAARAKFGTREAPGSANNPTILGWAKRLGTKVLGVIYNADSVPWCGVFVGACLDEADIDSPLFAVRAKSWATWGDNLRPERLAPGAVLVFERPGGGHVGFYVGEDAEAYHVLGGNQGDSVTIARIDKARCIARRWPSGRPVIGKPVMVAAGGRPTSRNEA
ncbi:TIGR02594 family protein [Sphingomonas rubra]|uniref:TIGR02594 family protein n=1 Tax=Sphingomonas rubra TaxID=634430 RepID=A0A1I5UX75_9SPHN|nr:TIGR02594 family protein [Sphingomonas rubra]SFP99830.1 TIGR02594 family protein [Sphingomonas rubra]